MINTKFEFKDNSKTVEKDLARILGAVSHHIHPQIIERIKISNIKYQGIFNNHCHPNLNMSDYFYDESDCVFPGVRRPVNNEIDGIKNWKGKTFKDGTILNDNTYPRHIWTFLTVKKPYSGGKAGSWNNSGLNKFELAHIFSHKVNERDLETKVFEKMEERLNPYALFTSASNVVLIPKGFAKPTDKMNSIKIVFYKRHLELYGNNLIGLGKFDESRVPSWYNDIKWLEPILPPNWTDKVDRLLEFRERHLKLKYKI